MEQETDFFNGVVKIALGIFLGGLLMWGALTLYWRYTVHVALNEADRALEQIGATASRQAERIRQDQQLTRQRAELRAREAAEQRALEQAQAANLARARMEAERQKEASWLRFYQPSADCLQTTSVECGNAYIRARQEFERTYVAR